MKIIEVLKRRKEGVAFEFFPPKTLVAKQSLIETVRTLKKYSPLYVSMTYGAAGSSRRRTKEVTFMLLEERDLVVMPHLTCIGATTSFIRNLLNAYRGKGVENIMALRGDLPSGQGKLTFKRQDFFNALDLVRFIKKFGDFCIGVAVYPEGHREDISWKSHLDYLKEKIDAGADFAVTQMFFKNSYFYRFLERTRKARIDIPVLPGILPLTDILKIKEFCKSCRVSIPKEIESKMSKYLGKPPDMEKVGLDFSIKQCKELLREGFRHLHFFTLNKRRVISFLLDNLLD